MGFDFTGHVLRAPRSAPGNQPTTNPATNGVVRDVRVPPVRVADQPALVDLHGDQYRTAVFEAPGTTQVEYLLWAENSSNLALVDDPSWAITEGTGRVPRGIATVGLFSDGTSRIIITDDGGRSIGSIQSITVVNGQTQAEVVLPVVANDLLVGIIGQDADAGIARLSSGALTALGGGLSGDRGDTVQAVTYTLAPCRFWWTRNDRYETRFGWNGELQRWAPYRGSAPKNLGVLEPDLTYQLAPLPVALPINSYTEGNPATLDAPAAVRVGMDAGATSLPVRIKVVANADAASFAFPEVGTDAVVGQTNGILAFDPAFVALHAGKVIWYAYKGFREDENGKLGKLLASAEDSLYIAPIPGPDDRPFIRIGTRRALIPTLLATDAAVLAASPSEGEVVVSLSTGRLKFSQADIDKADPDAVGFNKLWVGAVAYYDGVSLNAIPQQVRNPVTLINGAGATGIVGTHDPLYIPEMQPFPDGMGVGETYRGLGVSGVMFAPDATGAIPAAPGGTEVPVRAGGDNLRETTTGRVREVDDGVGELVVFSKVGAADGVTVVDRNDDLPPPFKIKDGRAYVSRQRTTIGGIHCSRVQLSSADQRRFTDESMFFMQASLTPAVYTKKARVVSRSRLVFRFQADQVLHFAIGAQKYAWTAPTVQPFYSAAEVAASIVATSVPVIAPAIGRAIAIGDRVAIEAADLDTGLVEIGWGVPEDLSGAAVMGFLPGWRAEGGKHNWLFDSGVSFGMSRSLLNLRRDKPDPDYVARGRIEDLVLQSQVQPNPFVFMDRPPLEDVAGYDEGVFFNIRNVIVDGDDVRIVDKRLDHFDEVLHGFGDRKFSWLWPNTPKGVVHQTINAITLGAPSVIPESLLPALGGRLQVSEDGGSYVEQVPGEDYLLPQEGGPGVAILTKTYGKRLLFGADGVFANGGTTFTVDVVPTPPGPPGKFQKVNFLAEVGDRLKIVSGDAAGSYTVTSVTSDNVVEVTPPFIAAGQRVSWVMFKGLPLSVYDPALVADHIYTPFTHVKPEPFKIRVLNPVDAVPVNKAAQSAARLVARVDDTILNERLSSLRFGPVHEALGAATLHRLGRTRLGVMSNGALFVPAGDHLTEGSFELLVGVTIIVPDPVAFNPGDPIGANAAEYHPATGELRFGPVRLTDNESADVWVVETFRDPDDLAAGEAEIDHMTGGINLSTPDMTAHAAKVLYYTEQMTVAGRKDVAVAPIVGAVSFRKPLPTGCLVEMIYWEADIEARRKGKAADIIEEFLPVFVRREEATRVSDHEYTFNTAEAHVLMTGDPSIQVWIGAMLQNYGTESDYSLRIKGNKGHISFGRAMKAHVKVEVTYMVLDTLGGERSYTTSRKPIYRPPFFVKKGRDNFGLRGNRTTDFTAGQMLRLGPESFYIKGTQYFPASDVTRVDITPPTVEEVGARSPGRDALALITALPITTHLDPDGANTPTGAPAGFWLTLDPNDHPFDPVVRNQSTITFGGDLSWVQPGHVLEVSGLPLTIGQVLPNEDGTRTTFSTTAPFRKSVLGSTVKVSRRPLYPPDIRTFLGVGPIVVESGHELVLFGEKAGNATLPGRTLALGVDYALDPETGVVALLGPTQAALAGGQRLYLYHTKLRQLRVRKVKGTIVQPRWRARGLHVTLPSEANGLLGSLLTATFTYAMPDSFYCRIPTLKAFLGEVAKGAAEEAKAATPGQGASWATFSGTDNWKQGFVGLDGQRRDLTDKDRVSRVFLDFYNKTVVAFEQIPETISGGFVGDRDGKFRFFLGRGAIYAPPGWEDAFTGLLNPRLIWARVFNEANSARQLTFYEADNLVHPKAADIIDGQLIGFFPDSTYLGELQERQRALILNDVDDRLLLGVGRPSGWTLGWPIIRGVFGRMADSHQYSRLFPTRARVFFTMMPGLGADGQGGDAGVFSHGTFIDGEHKSSWGQVIGQIGNPVMGPITILADKDLRQRRPRGRIWGYFPEGIPTNTFGAHAAIPGPCMVVTPLELAEVPINPATGFPDHTLLATADPVEGKPDIGVGHHELAIPGFAVGDQVAWGKPDGRLMAAKHLVEQTLFLITFLEDVFVETVQFGCVLTFMDPAGATITDPNKLLVGTSAVGGTPLTSFPIGRGDTVYVGKGSTTVPTIIAAGDTPTAEQIREAADALPSYREGFDLVARRDGTIVDRSMPSWDDPSAFPLREIMGQKPPAAMEHIEGVVEMVYAEMVPLKVPALLGEARDDSGDQRIPYMRAGNTELERFEAVSVGLADEIFRAPDEFFFNDGEILGAAAVDKPPAALLTPMNVLPGASEGVADLRDHDLLFVELKNPDAGWQGILSVGSVQHANGWTAIEPPRFSSPTTPPPYVATGPSHVAETGTKIRYRLENYAVFLAGPYATDPQAPPAVGAFVLEDTTNNRIVISTVDVPGFILHDGTVPGAGTGNLNYLMAIPGNSLHLKLYARADAVITAGPGGAIAPGDRHGDGDLLGTLEMESDGSATWTPEATGATVHPPSAIPVGAITYTFGDNLGAGYFPNEGGVQPHHIILDVNPGVHNLAANPFFDLSAPGGQEANWLIPHQVVAGPNRKVALYGLEFALTIETVGGHSTTAWIDTDRLTFHEVVDLNMAKPRDFAHPVSGLVLETGLRVFQCEWQVPNSWSVFNDINGGAFTFLPRDNAQPLKVGSDFVDKDGGVRPEGSSIKVMGFEGASNVPITGATITASAAASTAAVAGGTGDGTSGQIRLPVYATGGLADISRHDLLVIQQSNVAIWMCNKAGSYLVRWAADGTPFTADGTVGTAKGLVTEDFPRIVSFDKGTDTLILDDASGMPNAGRVYITLNAAGLGSANAATYRTSLFSATYAAVGNTLTLNAYQWATTAVAPTDPELQALEPMLFGRMVSWSVAGLQEIPVSIRSPQFPTVPDMQGDKIAAAATKAIYGVRHLTVTTGHGDTLPLHANTGNPSNDSTITDAAGVLVGEVGVEEATPFTAEVFRPEDTIYFTQVPNALHFKLSAGQWNTLNNKHGHANADVQCLVPDTVLTLGSGAVGGFVPVDRLTIEPSWPEVVSDLSSGTPRVVDATHSLNVTDLGFLENPATEGVSFEVRRIRRFGGGELAGNIEPLRFAYEIRRGKSTGWSQLPDQSCIIHAAGFTMTHPAAPEDVWNTGLVHDGTQLGAFDDPDVNLNPGDVLRVLNADGTVTEAEILESLTPTAMRVAAPGVPDTTGLRFEVYLRQAPVPHEQTNEQLLDLITDKVVHTTAADYTTQLGGRCEGVDILTWGAASNVLKDNSPGAPNYLTIGVKPGDIIIIDSAEDVGNDERGARPQGDKGVPVRVGALAYAVSPFDDNRGFYRVTDVAADALEVTGVMSFAGENADDKVFGDVGYEYAVLPTVSSTFIANPGTEGQNDLRPTAVRVGNTYGTTPYSIEPFSYRIIRPSPLFERETVDLILFLRERMLSWIEELRTAFNGTWGGDFWAFQDEEHISDLGTPGTEVTIQGLFPNIAVTSLLGELGVTPFLNTTDCLSLLDRRFWILDARLDTLRPDGNFRMQMAAGGGNYGTATGPYTAFAKAEGDQGRPVLPDRVALTLDETERFRAYRYTWLSYRTHRLSGLLTRIQRFDAERPIKEAERQRAILLQASVDKT